MANSIDDEQDKADVGEKLDKLNNEKEDLDQIGSYLVKNLIKPLKL